MISHRRKFIFIHIGKTGGQSVERALRSFAFSMPQRLVRYIDIRTAKKDPLKIKPAGAHPSVDQMKAAIGIDLFDAYFSFSFVRNPWDRAYSSYKFKKTRPKSPDFDLVNRLSFNDFLEETLSKKKASTSQSELLLDLDGTEKVNFVGRFETLERDFQTVCTKIGCSANLPHKNKTGGPNYQKAYTPRSADLIAQYYADDVKNFGYSFE